MLALSDQAMAGDKGAAKLILEYAVGKPQAAREPDRVEFEEWQIAKEKLRLWPFPGGASGVSLPRIPRLDQRPIWLRCCPGGPA